jgi:hypothetical protein
MLAVGAVLTAGAAVTPAAGQVGHDPAHSPFRDLPGGSGPSFTAGWLGGDRGRVGVGHADGITWTLRYEAQLSRTFNFAAGLTYALTDRFIVDQFLNENVRKQGPVADDMALVDVGFQFLLTGRKTWRGLTPYISTTMGVAVSRGSPADTSGYSFGTKLTLSPGVGVRFYPARRVNLTLDARALFWRLRYPPDYRVPSSPDGTIVLPSSAPETDWTMHPWISVGLGWTF